MTPDMPCDILSQEVEAIRFSPYGPRLVRFAQEKVCF
ncbi:hypothetical protein MTY_0227 [Moorella thermoacetica Y72]|uniref:Uncharacterized protein n=1 Tax=Moorella thermoacetica Y72 TaxID=1325331 RepID=A0A0S6UAS2_NEOTH|nr:hypothetical protein MTY_0227 [Moorella thermoacetica Y72]